MPRSSIHFRTANASALEAGVEIRTASPARRLLRDGSEPVQAIAKRCGFSSPVHFSRLFSRHVGSSPQRYRAAWRESLAGGADGGRTVQDALRSLRNKSSIAGGTLTVCEEDDSTPAWTATVTTAAGDPLSSIDPA